LLSPYEHPLGNKYFASLCDIPGYIIIYSRPIGRPFLKRYLKLRGTLFHESGHIMDANIRQDGEIFSHSSEWSEAQKNDNDVIKSSLKYSGYWIFGSAEVYLHEHSENWALEEDFADSIRYYAMNRSSNRCLRKNYPNRYKLVKRLLNDD